MNNAPNFIIFQSIGH